MKMSKGLCPLCNQHYPVVTLGRSIKQRPRNYSLLCHLETHHKTWECACGCWCGGTFEFWGEWEDHLKAVGGVKHHALMAKIANL